MIPSTEAIEKQKAFERAYVFAEPFSRHVNGCSLQTVSFLGRIHGDLRLGRHPEELCLYVFLERKMPPDMTYPVEFRGMHVVTRVVGEIRDEEPIYESSDGAE